MQHRRKNTFFIDWAHTERTVRKRILKKIIIKLKNFIKLFKKKNVIGEILSHVCFFKKKKIYFFIFKMGASLGNSNRGGGSGRPWEAAGGWCATTVPPARGWEPKMRHLVLYKLAGFCPADKVPLNGELC